MREIVSMYCDILLVEDESTIVPYSWGGGIVTQPFPTTQGILSIFAATFHKRSIVFLNFLLIILRWLQPPIIMTLKNQDYNFKIVA